ncbi:MAG: hypothetical protein K2X99_11045 [Gemmatimonadaceae bacterium]|nr:hypothetical protein [Gemmatimonadaceae bacterium]
MREGREDDILMRAVAVLRPLPARHPRVIARILATTAGRSRSWAGRLQRWMTASVPRPLAAAVAGLTLVAGYVVGVRRDESTAEFAAVSASTPVRTVANVAGQGVQFVLDAPSARSVAVVGDFNEWSATASPLVREPGSGAWTTTVALPPGRHVYAFIVDGVRWTMDPHAPLAPDADFGRAGSVVLVPEGGR